MLTQKHDETFIAAMLDSSRGNALSKKLRTSRMLQWFGFLGLVIGGTCTYERVSAPTLIVIAGFAVTCLMGAVYSDLKIKMLMYADKLNKRTNTWSIVQTARTLFEHAQVNVRENDKENTS